MVACSLTASALLDSAARCVRNCFTAVISNGRRSSLPYSVQGVIDDPRVRRQQGAHYTSERDILKVLQSLFLNDLRTEWEQIAVDRSSRQRAAIVAFHGKLRSLTFFDPACGCGNFLVLAYRELRMLEIAVVRKLTELSGGQQQLPIIDVDQFFGTELFEWPVRIAEVALWLMDHQMNQQASELFGRSLDRLPLRSAPHIVHDNALRRDWDSHFIAAQDGAAMS